MDAAASAPEGVLKKPFIVTPAKAGAQVIRWFWMPACAGMTAFSVFP
jgi:hypothetical protein